MVFNDTTSVCLDMIWRIEVGDAVPTFETLEREKRRKRDGIVARKTASSTAAVQIQKKIVALFKTKCQRKLTRCGFGSYAQPPKLYMEMRYLTIVFVCHIELGFGWANWAAVAHFHFGDHFWPFLAIFQMALAPKIFQV